MKNKVRILSLSAVSLVFVLVFIFPLLAATVFSFRGFGGKGYSFTNYQWLLQQDGFWPSLGESLKLATLSASLNIILMVPTMVFLNLRGQRWKPFVDFICVLPLIIPVVSLAIGAQVAMPEFLQNTEYELVFFFVVTTLPYTFRALDTALSAISLNTLVEASRSLGATWTSTIIRVIIPSIKSGIISTLFLSFALAIGEYTITSLLHWETFPTWTVVVAQQNILGAVAISIFSFVSAILLMGIVGAIADKKRESQVKQ